MNDELADIWQGQATTGLTISLDEIKKRVQRLRGSLTRRRRLGMTAIFLGLAASIGSLLFFGNPAAAWLRVAHFVLWVLFIIYTPAIFRKRIAAPEGRVLTLNMLAVTTPCIAFYRSELEARRDDLRNSRGVAPVLVLLGAAFAALGTRWPRDPMPALVAGTIVMVFAVAWYVQTKRESPRIQAELDDLEAFSPKDDQPSGNRR